MAVDIRNRGGDGATQSAARGSATRFAAGLTEPGSQPQCGVGGGRWCWWWVILPVMSLQGLVDATATALGGARELYGQAAQASGLPSTSGLQSLKTDLRASVDTVPATWRGAGERGTS